MGKSAYTAKTKAPGVTRDPKKLIELAAIYLDDGAWATALMYLGLASIRIEAQVARRRALMGEAQPVADASFDRRTRNLIRRTFPNER